MKPNKIGEMNHAAHHRRADLQTPLTQEELDAVEVRMAPCLDLYNVRWIRSFWSADRRRMICEYDAADVASVHNVQREAAAKFDRAWAADVLGG